MALSMFGLCEYFKMIFQLMSQLMLHLLIYVHRQITELDVNLSSLLVEQYHFSYINKYHDGYYQSTNLERFDPK